MTSRRFHTGILALTFSVLAPSRLPALSPVCFAKLLVRTSSAPASCPNDVAFLSARVYLTDHDTPVEAKSAANAPVAVARPFMATPDTLVVAGPRYTGEDLARTFTTQDMESSAGTFGDPSRYLQSFAGVVSDNDQRNDFLVRGGNPSENGFVIDGIEIPSINQLALSDTTGGFVSMLDAAAVQRITLHTDAYDSKFDQRLSSIIEISTRSASLPEARISTEIGMAGMGGSRTGSLGKSGSYFVSGRRSVLNLLTSDIGMNGVPIYNNGFLRADGQIDSKNTWWGISLTGIDSIKIHPTLYDAFETNPYNISYSGWRNTTGVNWQHLFSSRAFGVASVAHAQQNQTINESAQMLSDASIYSEATADGISTLKYDFTFQPSKFFTLNTGSRLAVDQLSYDVAQPIGLQNPYSQDPAPVDASSFSKHFATASSAAYIEAVAVLPHGARLIAGERVAQWALGGHTGATSKVSFEMPFFGRITSIGYSQLTQLPSTLYLLSFDNLAALKPIRSSQLTGTMQVADARHARITLSAYQKLYSDYPVARDYPQLSMANIADTFGQAFLMFPMVGAGKGVARGVELTTQSHITNRLNLALTTAYARSWYSGRDGILRRGNYDIPLSANLTGTYTFGKGFLVSWRYNVTSGRPYTPDNMPLSVAQNRDVYELDQINGLRSSNYQRLDFHLEQSRKLGRGVMTWHAGLQNALNHKNFYSRLWEPQIDSNRTGEQDQMPLFPDGGVKFVF